MSVLSSEQFCELGRISPSVLPALWGGLGLVVLDLAPSQLQLDFGTDDTERLQDGKSGKEKWSNRTAEVKKVYGGDSLEHPY